MVIVQNENTWKGYFLQKDSLTGSNSKKVRTQVNVQVIAIKIKIKKASAKDLPTIKRLIKMYPRQLMQMHLPRTDQFFLAAADGRIVGCCALEIYSKRLAEIRSLAVEKSFQGKGIGTKLIRHCLALADRERIAEVLAITGAVILFERAGFKTFRKEKFALLKILK